MSQDLSTSTGDLIKAPTLKIRDKDLEEELLALLILAQDSAVSDILPEALSALSVGACSSDVRHAMIEKAIRSLWEAGEPVSMVTVISWIRRTYPEQQILKGSGDLAAMIGLPSCVGEWRQVIKHLNSLHRARSVLETCTAIGSQSAWAASDPDSWAQVAEDRLRVLMDGHAAKPTHKAWPLVHTVDLLMGQMDPLRWICQDLELGPGRPFGVWAKPSAGKSLGLESLVVSVASGRMAFERFAVRRGRVLYLNLDAGSWSVQVRIRQLANGLGLSPESLEDRIHVVNFPDCCFADPRTEVKLTRECEQYDLAILDCLREASGGADENDPNAAAPLRMLTRISDRTGCTWGYVHHLRKTQAGDRETDVSLDSARGTSAIAAASGAVWAVTGAGSEARRWHHLRNHDASSGIRSDFYLRLLADSVAPAIYSVPSELPTSLLLSAVDSEERAKEQFHRTAGHNLVEFSQKKDRVCEWLAANPGASKRALRAALKGNGLGGNTGISDVVDDLVLDGRVIKLRGSSRGGNSEHYYTRQDAIRDGLIKNPYATDTEPEPLTEPPTQTIQTALTLS